MRPWEPGSPWTCTHPDQSTADRWSSEAFDEVDRLEALLSNYRPTSELSRISREAGEHPVTTDPETFAFLGRALHWSRLPTGPSTSPSAPPCAPGASKHTSRTGHPPRKLPSCAAQPAGSVSASTPPRAPSRLPPASRWSLTQAASARASLSIASWLCCGVMALRRLCSAGGSTLYGLGAPPGKAGWPVEIPDPRTPHTLAATVLLHDNSLSTGACDQKYVVLDGHRYCHIFDPRTLTPVEGVLQATVVSPSATDSDALSTIVFVQSLAETRALLRRLPHTGAMLSQPVQGSLPASPFKCRRPTAPQADSRFSLTHESSRIYSSLLRCGPGCHRGSGTGPAAPSR